MILFDRFLREVREKYLHSGSPLELPAETRNRLRVNKASRLTLAQLKELQSFMVQGLREYWWVEDKLVAVCGFAFSLNFLPQLSNYRKLSTLVYII